MADGIELTEFISALRRDLQLSVAGSTSEPLRFGIEELELELELEAARAEEAKGTGSLKLLKFWVVGGIEAGGEKTKSHSGSRVQRIKLKLKPVWNGDERIKLLVADEQSEKPR